MSQAVVERIKNELVAKGVNLTGVCGAFEITKRVAWELRDSGLGLLWKGHTNGNDCQGYAGGHVMMPDGTHWDPLGDAGGANIPQWNLVVYTADDPDPAHKPLIGQPFKRPEMYRAPFNDWDEETPETPDDDPFVAMRDQLRLIRILLETVGQDLDMLVDRKPSSYQGKIFGYTITLEPVPKK